jgi:secernin
MCDTLIATKLATSDGIAVFGKNSDRPPNEGQHIAYFPASKHGVNNRVKCTYIEIPQVEKTHAVLLSKPFWMWGAEMGINEHGLVIGNEAVFSKIPPNKEPALLGMDMLRAALERAVTPREALQVIIDLLEQFGQGGNCASHGETSYYHNSFLIANAEDAWVLETVDKQWAARQVKDLYSISNCLTLGGQWDMASPGLVELAVQKGFSKSAGQFNYARDYSDFIFTNFSKGRTRRATTIELLEQDKGSFNIQSMMSALRHHNDENFDPQSAGLTSVDVCMHAGFGPIRISQSTASMVAYLDGNTPIIFVTGTSAPCTSIFKPMWIASRAASSLNLGPIPTSTADPSSLFWSHERLHRATLLNYPERIKTFAGDRDKLENKFVQGALSLSKASAETRADFSAQCFREAAQAEVEWLKRVESVPPKGRSLHSSAWSGFNKKAEVKLRFS